ncbi:MAG TPA: hypothetical protein VEH30_06465 [Terriglobales bacterium]|nr:hypothetical protein [Terriglobales bacterium]
MSSDVLYSYLIDLTWFFLSSWVVLLAAACLVAFNGDWLQRTTRNLK